MPTGMTNKTTYRSLPKVRLFSSLFVLIGVALSLPVCKAAAE